MSIEPGVLKTWFIWDVDFSGKIPLQYCDRIEIILVISYPPRLERLMILFVTDPHHNYPDIHHNICSRIETAFFFFRAD